MTYSFRNLIDAHIAAIVTLKGCFEIDGKGDGVKKSPERMQMDKSNPQWFEWQNNVKV